MLTPEQLAEIKARNPVSAVAGQWVRLRKNLSRSGWLIGSCPICSPPGGTWDGTRFECDDAGWVCAVCQEAGDVIKLVMKREGVAFADAIQRLGGASAASVSPATARAAGSAAARAGRDCEANGAFDVDALRQAFVEGWQAERKKINQAVIFRERERLRLLRLWQNASRLSGSSAEAYLKTRGYIVPAHAQLRSHPSIPMFAAGRARDPVLLHRGPAMLAKISGDGGVFQGLHITWLDPNGPKGKARIVDRSTGQVMPAKKCRGSKAGGYIDLGFVEVRPGPRMFAGEGIETVLAAHTALVRSGRARVGDQFRSAIDLGNLAGKAAMLVPHPNARTSGGRVQRVPGPEPDARSACMPVQDAIKELVLLGDGDSDPFTTRNALERSRARHERADRTVRCVFPDRQARDEQ
jgi:hypothetical protein